MPPYTLAMIASQQPNIVALYDKLPYDPVKDFAPISLLASAPYFIIVHPSVAATSVKEFIALAKNKPDLLRYASAGPGSAPHLATEVFRNMTGTSMLHVPYKGSTPEAYAAHIRTQLEKNAACHQDRGR